MKKIITLILSISMCISLCSCSFGKTDDFLCFNLGMTKDKITKVAEEHNGTIRESKFGSMGTLSIETDSGNKFFSDAISVTFENGYEGFSAESMTLDMFISEDTGLGMITGVLTYIYNKDEGEPEECANIMKYFENQYGEQPFTNIKTKKGRQMDIEVKKEKKSKQELKALLPADMKTKSMEDIVDSYLSSNEMTQITFSITEK